MLFSNRKKYSFPNNASTEHFKKKHAHTYILNFISISESWIPVLFTCIKWNWKLNQFFPHTSNYSWVKELSQHQLDLPSSSISELIKHGTIPNKWQLRYLHWNLDIHLSICQSRWGTNYFRRLWKARHYNSWEHTLNLKSLCCVLRNCIIESSVFKVKCTDLLYYSLRCELLVRRIEITSNNIASSVFNQTNQQKTSPFSLYAEDNDQYRSTDQQFLTATQRHLLTQWRQNT